MEIGYKLASEEHGPNELVRFAGLAEEHGFSFSLISDHFHPWIDRQGQSPFVWSVIGAIAHTTKRLRLGTAVTCPTVRVHPAIVDFAERALETTDLRLYLRDHARGVAARIVELADALTEQAARLDPRRHPGGAGRGHHGVHDAGQVFPGGRYG